MTAPRAEQLPDHAARLEQARRRAGWELGEPSWADLIVDAYCDPASDATELEQDMAESEGRPL